MRITALIAVLTFAAASAHAESVVYFIGDGMGPSQVTAARIYKTGADGAGLTLDSMPHVGLVRTWAANGLVTDSAAAGTALASGVKTNMFAIGMDPAGNPVESMAVKAKRKGMSVGIISTARLTHATPACFYGHTRNRFGEGELAAQLVESEAWDLAMGGGRGFFMTQSQADGETGEMGLRGDGRDLLKESADKGIRVVQSREQFDALVRETEAGADPGRVLGVFNADHMAYELERGSDVWGEPSLREMTELALRILSRNPNGFFLMVEGGRIDHACHDGKARLAVTDLIAMDEAVAASLAWQGAGGEKALVVVTADHETGGLAINGYTTPDVRGDALMTDTRSIGKEVISFASGPGATRPEPELDRLDPNYRQQALHASDSASHTGVDVAVYAQGPGAEVFDGTMDNTEVAKRIMRTMGVE